MAAALRTIPHLAGAGLFLLCAVLILGALP